VTAKKTTGSSKGTSRSKKLTGGPVDNGRESDDADGRLGRRVPIQLLVDYKADGNYLFDFCKDLGTGGVFIQTSKPLPMGAAIDLTFTIPDSKETLMTKGTVIWVQSPVTERKDLTPGMGVQFSGFSGEQRRLLEEFVVRYHGRQATPGNDNGSKRAG